MMVACEVSTMETVRPILETLGKPIHVGAEPGMGQMVKVINNLMSVTALSIASEALVLATKAGLDPDILIEVVNSGSGSSNATMTKIPKFVLTRSFDFGFSIGLSAKDIRLCLEESDALGVPMIVGGAVRQLLTVAKGDLGAGADLTEIIKPIEGWAGVTVAGENARLIPVGLQIGDAVHDGRYFTTFRRRTVAPARGFRMPLPLGRHPGAGARARDEGCLQRLRNGAWRVVRSGGIAADQKPRAFFG